MTENEAIKRIQDHAEIHRLKERHAIYLTDAFDMAISALKEIQQYREIDVQIKKIFDGQLGLVNIVKEYIEDIRRIHNGKTPRKVIALTEEDAQKWEDYQKNRIRGRVPGSGREAETYEGE